jgi:hypothetical protein
MFAVCNAGSARRIFYFYNSKYIYIFCGFDKPVQDSRIAGPLFPAESHRQLATTSLPGHENSTLSVCQGFRVHHSLIRLQRWQGFILCGGVLLTVAMATVQWQDMSVVSCMLPAKQLDKTASDNVLQPEAAGR